MGTGSLMLPHASMGNIFYFRLILPSLQAMGDMGQQVHPECHRHPFDIQEGQEFLLVFVCF
jgi:hypothetical protein